MHELIVAEQYASDMPLHKFILLVGDNEMLASLLLAAITRRTSYLIEHVADGQSALEIVVHIMHHATNVFCSLYVYFRV